VYEWGCFNSEHGIFLFKSMVYDVKAFAGFGIKLLPRCYLDFVYADFFPGGI